MNKPTTIEEEEINLFIFSSSSEMVEVIALFLMTKQNEINQGGVMMGSGEILVILVVILILFGGKKLPEFAQSLGKGIREFKKACYEEEDHIPSKTIKENSAKSSNLPCQSPPEDQS